jgi:uncharacterized membrane-anchored protein YitT (DUF2179 family)
MNLKKLKNLKQYFSWKSTILLTIAGIINAIGVTMFLAPVNLYDSGISGTAILLSQVTPDWMSLPLFLILLNVPLFLYGMKKEGVQFTVNAIYTVAIYSITAWLITDILPVDVSIVSPLAGSDLLLCALFGGVISGAGSGIALRSGGAMDGIEVMAVIFSKKLGVSVGTFVMAYNVVLYVVCGFVIDSWILPLYSIVSYFSALKTVDYIVEGIDRSKSAMIVTVNPQEVSSALSEAFGCGMTLIHAKGFYSDSPKTVIYLVINRFQIVKAKNIVHANDPQAYIAISDVADVFKANH